MLETEKRVIYRAFGCNIFSDIPLPELSKREGQTARIDIEIKIQDVPQEKSYLAQHPYKHVVKGKEVTFYVPNIGFFSAREGKKIVVSPAEGADDGLIRLYILGTCMGAILMQRKILPLHGSAVVINGKAYAFIGNSGAGKSTLASAFLKEGYHILTDDIIAVSFAKDNTPIVTPSYPQQKLWQESLNKFGIETSGYRSIYGRETKYCVPVFSQYSPDPVPLAGVFELVKMENKMVEAAPVEKLSGLHTLFKHTYRNFLIPRLELMEWHFGISANIVNQMNIYQLWRPISTFSVAQLVDVILDIVNKGD
jgi:hypothetical protein